MLIRHSQLPRPLGAHALVVLAILPLLGSPRPATGQTTAPRVDVPEGQAPAGEVAPATPEDRARALLARADGLRLTGSASDALAAVVACAEAATLVTGVNERLLAEAQLTKALALVAAGLPEDALLALEGTLAAARALPDRALLVRTLALRTELLGTSGQVADARLAAREMAAALQESGDFDAEGRAHLLAADFAAEAGHADEAATSLAAALAVFRHLGDASLERETLERRARLEVATGRAADALDTLHEALPPPEDPDADRTGRLQLLACTAELALGRLGRALSAAQAAREAFTEAANVEGQADAMEAQATLLLAVVQPRAAADLAVLIIALRRQLGDRAGEGRAQHGLGASLVALGRFEPALATFREARELLAADARPSDRAAVLLAEGRTQLALRHWLDASRSLEDALGLLPTGRQPAQAGAAPPRLAALPSREDILRPLLESLVRADAWARALEVSLEEDGHESWTIDAWRDRARDEEASILFAKATEAGLLTWGLAADGTLVGALVDFADAGEPARLAARAAELAQPLTLSTPGQAADDAGMPSLHDLLGRLHDALVAPVEAALPSAAQGRLVIVAAPPLDAIPFALLLDDDGRTLAERFVLTELTSSTPAPAVREGGDTLVVDALGDRPSSLLTAVKNSLSRRRKSRFLPRATTAGSTEPDERESSAPGLAELVTVHGGASFLAGAAAHPTALRGRAGSASIVQLLATCRTGAEPGSSVLELPAEPDGSSGDLGPADVARLPLAGTTVLLAPCSGAAAAELSRALLAAGARHVIALRWELPQSLGERVQAALAAALASGRTAPEAVNVVQAELRQEAPVATGALRILGPAR